MLKFEDIVDAPVAKLKSAADDWSEMVVKLDRLAEDAHDGMKAKADKAEWEGVNAGVTKGFIGKTAKEFKDAAAEAKGVKQILEDACAAIKKAKDELISIRDDEGPSAGIHVDARGKVTARHPYEKSGVSPNQDPDYFEILGQQKKAIEAWQKKIDLIVDNCNDTDVAFKNALEANVTEGRDFTAPKYENLDQEEAARAAALAGKGRDITHTELQALNELLHDNGRSREFAKNFYEKLGPEKSLAFFGQLSTDTYEYGKVHKERLKDVQALQKNLGLNLATASHDKAFTAEWGPELRKLGTERIPLTKYDSGGPFGYQLLGGIMRYGNYDAKFLNPIAEHVAQLHQKDPYMFADSKLVNSPFKNPFNPSGANGSGYDPTVSMLEALGHSPDAAKHFFSDGPTMYKEDGTANKEAVADLGKADGVAIDNYLDFFGNEKWKSFGDVDSLDPKEQERSLGYMPDALGHALEAATLGYPYDSPNAGVERDAGHAGVMRDVMEKYGSDAGLLKKQEAMADSLGIMGAGYIDDINWSLEKNDSDSVFAPSKNPGGHLDFSIVNSDGVSGNGRDVARQFLSTLGQHPDAYATLSNAEQIYTTGMLERQVDSSGEINQGAARSVVGTGAEVQGMLDQSRADQVVASDMKKQEDYEKAVSARSGWIEFGAGVGVAAGVAFLPPVAAVGAAATLITLGSDTASGAVEHVIGQFIGNLSDQSVDEHKEKVEELTREEKTRVFRSGESMAEAPMEGFLERHTTAADTAFRQDLKESMRIGYAIGNDRENQQGSDPETGD
ncbi:hypothetical protein PUR34_26430 [Streptomyces sp. JV185]|uniref:hypothetical protein n=1 Tax=Streptomyces sp. JV185 TaxID=858638 RepID=UPI002E78C40B|nr:hypothetical protein [Streptomyces sp. JV185]MEE1771591.1 hypothetical protein [Streptomyces sp. JV185]